MTERSGGSMEDMISKKAAIDAVYKCDDIFVGDMPVMVVKADAYEALAQLPSAQPDSKELSPTHKALDTISRQAAIDALTSHIMPHNNEDGTVTIGVLSKSSIKNILNKLPSAQPETHDKRTKTHSCDCISRQAAIDAVEFGITYAKAINKSTGEVKELFKEGNKALNEAVERIKDLPSAQSEPSQAARDIATILENEKDMRVIKKNAESESCADTISRKAAIDAVMEFMPSLTTPDGCGQFDREIFEAQEMFVDIGHALNDLPSAQPQRTGRWKKVNGKINCSACNHCSWSLSFEDTVKRFNFCPNCGADMRKENQ